MLPWIILRSSTRVWLWFMMSPQRRSHIIQTHYATWNKCNHPPFSNTGYSNTILLLQFETSLLYKWAYLASCCDIVRFSCFTSAIHRFCFNSISLTCNVSQLPVHRHFIKRADNTIDSARWKWDSQRIFWKYWLVTIGGFASSGVLPTTGIAHATNKLSQKWN